MFDFLFNFVDRVITHRANRMNITFSDAYGWAYTDPTSPDIIRLYLRGIVSNNSDKQIALNSVHILPTTRLRITAKEAPFLIAGINDIQLMATDLPVLIPPQSACKIDTIFHSTTKYRKSLRLPSVGTLPTLETIHATLRQNRLEADSSNAVWKTKFQLSTSRGDVVVRVPVDWRDSLYTFSSLAARDRLSR